MKILLIAGHGGTPYDSGAVGNGYKEAIETRRMVTAVAPLLRQYGFDVSIYDQSKDAYKIITQGGSIPLDGISYVLEFHLNSAANDSQGNGKTTGTEIFIHTHESGITVEQAILKHICALGFTNRGVKRSSGLAVLKHVFNRGVSHALVETCFIDDKDDMRLYSQKFNNIVEAIANGVAEGFGKDVQGVKMEDTEMVEKKTVTIDNENYTCGVIEKAGENYVKLRDFAQAGYNITYDAKNQMPGILAPQTRSIVRDNAEVQSAIEKLQKACGLEEPTMQYLLRYEYGDDLILKLAMAIK